jgi:thioredoxin 1
VGSNPTSRTEDLEQSVSNMVTVTDKTFAADVLRHDTPVLVDFWAEWCGPCKMIAPVLNEIAGEQQGKLRIAKFNIDENPLMARQYSIRSIPLLILFKDGKVVKQILGAKPKRKIMDDLREFIG